MAGQMQKNAVDLEHHCIDIYRELYFFIYLCGREE